MRSQERFLPRHVQRFNYWEFFRPGALRSIAPLQEHIRTQFKLLLTASPSAWNEAIRPWLHKELDDVPDRQFFALEYYVENDKEWEQDKEAWKIFKQLSADKQAQIRQLSKSKWHYHSQWTWKTLLQTIARDQERFKDFCEASPESGALKGTDQRIYITYSKQATKLLGGGSRIPKTRRKIFRDYKDGSSLLTSDGRLPSDSIFWFRWQDLSPKDRREAKAQTLHWFNHALRNLREYHCNRPPIPWTPKCAESCRRIQKKLCAL